MQVQHFMTTDPVACDITATCGDVARLMRERNVGFVVCLQNNKVAGCVTDRQICIDVVGADLDAPSTPISDVMTQSPARVTPQDNIFAVVDTMRSAGVVNRLPVVNSENELVGVVSLSDIAVIAEDLIQAVLLDTTHRATKEARILTGAKRFIKQMRRPTKLDRFPEEGRARRVTIRRESGLHHGGRPARRGKYPANTPNVNRRGTNQGKRGGRTGSARLSDPRTPGRSFAKRGRANTKSRARNRRKSKARTVGGRAGRKAVARTSR
jgi:CBS domain-containing protein